MIRLRDRGAVHAALLRRPATEQTDALWRVYQIAAMDAGASASDYYLEKSYHCTSCGEIVRDEEQLRLSCPKCGKPMIRRYLGPSERKVAWSWPVEVVYWEEWWA